MTKSWTTSWRKRGKRRVGLDLSARHIRLVVLETSESVGWHCLHAVHLPLHQGALNGLVIEDFDEIADLLRHQVQELGLQGCPVAMALPAQGVREISWPAWDGPPQLWQEPQVYKFVQQHLQLPQGAWSFDFGLDHASSSQMAWAVVARESVVQERYELAEQAGLLPAVLDIDRLAIDRVLNEACKKRATWPTLWLMGRHGVLSAHAALVEDHVCSASAYAVSSVSELPQLKTLIDEALNFEDIGERSEGPASVVCTGLQESNVSAIGAVQVKWPHSIEQASPSSVWLEAWDQPDEYAVSLGLAMHPGLV